MTKKLTKYIVLFLIVFSLAQITAYSEQEDIDINLTDTKLIIEGESLTEDILFYKGSIYAPIRQIAEMLNLEVEWFEEARLVNVYHSIKKCDDYDDVSTINEDIIAFNGHYDPRIPYQALDVKKEDIYGVAFENLGDSMEYQLQSKCFRLIGIFPTDFKREIKVIKKDESIVTKTIIAKPLPEVEVREEFQVLIVPASPKEGFNFPYMLRIPGKEDIKYKTNKKYLTFDMINNGIRRTLNRCAKDVTNTLSQEKQSSVKRAASLGYPIMMPIIPRNTIKMRQEDFGVNYTYEHALNRSSVFLKELTTIDSNAAVNIKTSEQSEFEYQKYYDLDKQILAMMKHSINYLNNNNFQLEEKLILDGYSASGVFVDRFSKLHPSIVKMAISGGTLDDMMLPIDEYKNEKLNYPLGVADYKEITSREFDLAEHNSISRLIYMGEEDDRNVVVYSDSYFTKSQEQISRLYGIPLLSRARELMTLYPSKGANAMFVLDKKIKHTTSRAMRDFILEFIIANADSDKPVYPTIINKKQLEAIVYK